MITPASFDTRVYRSHHCKDWMTVAVFRDRRDAAFARDVAQKYGVDYFFVKDEDAMWQRRDTWVWSSPAVYENRRVRIIASKDIPQGDSPSTAP